MISLITIIIITLCIIIAVVIIVLPANISSKIAAAAVTVGLLLAVYGLYLNYQQERRMTIINTIDKAHTYWLDILKQFSNPDLENMYTYIYGNSIPPDEHIIFSMIIQTIENIINANDAGIYLLDSEWINNIKKWISYPNFKIFWDQNKKLYNIEVQQFISNLI